MRSIHWCVWAGLVVLVGGARAGRADGRPPPAVPAEAKPAPSDPGPLDELVARAARDGKPLVVEFYTGWCAPCRVFDAQVLADPRVQAELAAVRFVRYDAEHGSGIAAAERLKVSTYPTFVALDDQGEARARRSGADLDPAWFIGFLQRSAVVAQPEERLLAARKRAPGDARIAEQTGRWYLERDRPADALAHLDAAIAADRANAQGVAAEAAWQAAGIRRATELRTRLTKELLAYVRSYPGSAHAAEALTIATVGGAAPAAERRALWQQVVNANQANASRLNEIAYDALAAGELDAALAAARRHVELTSRSPDSLDTLAEVLHARRDQAEALARLDEALAVVPPGDPRRRTLDANRARFAAGAGAPAAEITAIKRAVAALWQRGGAVALDRSDDTSSPMADVMARMNAYRAARAGVVAEAGAPCRPLAGGLTEAYARIDLGGATPRITILEPDASPALKQCLVEHLGKADYPKRPTMAPPKAVDRIPLADDPKMMMMTGH